MKNKLSDKACESILLYCALPFFLFFLPYIFSGSQIGTPQIVAMVPTVIIAFVCGLAISYLTKKDNEFEELWNGRFTISLDPKIKAQILLTDVVFFVAAFYLAQWGGFIETEAISPALVSLTIVAIAAANFAIWSALSHKARKNKKNRAHAH